MNVWQDRTWQRQYYIVAHEQHWMKGQAKIQLKGSV